MKCDRYVAYDRHNCKGAEHVKLRVKHFLTVASIINKHICYASQLWTMVRSLSIV